MLAFALQELDAHGATRVGASLAAREELRTEGVLFAATEVTGPAVLLGAHQRRASVLREGSSVAVVRRATGGTASFTGERAVLFSLAMARVNALAPDATPATLLNRVVRGFLQGFTNLGARATYTGRDWVGFAKQPGAHLSFEQWGDGVTLVEVLVGLDVGFEVPVEARADEEGQRAARRQMGRASVALSKSVGRAMDADELTRVVRDAQGKRWMREVRATHERVDPSGYASRSPHAGAVVGEAQAHEPFPADVRVRGEIDVPAGLLEGGRSEPRGELHLAGDLLVPSYVLRGFERAATGREEQPPEALTEQAPMEGVRAEDLWGVLTELREA